jgi:ArsR family transcriptional regulator
MPICRAVAPSAPSELAWILNLLTQTARYAEPALAELDASLLPGIGTLRAPIAERARRLWRDDRPGCTELLLCADAAGCLLGDDPAKLFAWLRRGAERSGREYELLTEKVEDRAYITARLDRLRADVAARAAYLELLRDIWNAVAPEWIRLGRRIATDACQGWRARIETGAPIDELAPPRHPLTRADQLGLEGVLERRGEFALSPVYFCMSGGHVVDLGDYVHVAVPASDLMPIRRVRDAAFVADRLRVLAEPTRVRILLELLSKPSGVMDLARYARVSQPTVSGHLKVLREAGLVQPQRFGGRSVFVASRKRIERLMEDARATIARWD